ncbi:MAG: hypothetical protein M3O28_03915 [Actinomycetota bacterium]|nr:hypothetical protein [Actinomycetota bacterium]
MYELSDLNTDVMRLELSRRHDLLTAPHRKGLRELPGHGHSHWWRRLRGAHRHMPQF